MPHIVMKRNARNDTGWKPVRKPFRSFQRAQAFKRTMARLNKAKPYEFRVVSLKG